MKKFFTHSRIQQIILMLVDLVVINGAYYASVLLHFYFNLPPEKYEMLVARIPYITVIYIGIFMALRLYKNLWRYMGFLEVTKTVIGAGIGTLLTFLVDYAFMKAGYIFGINCLPLAAYVDAFLFITFLCVAVRTCYKSYRALRNSSKRRVGTVNKNIMLIGAGNMGNSVLYEMSLSGYKFGSPVCIVDDDPAKQKLRIRDIPVAGKTEDIPKLVREYDVNEIIFCINVIEPERKKAILNIAMSTGCSLKLAPNIDEYGGVGKSYTDRIRKVEILDLLSRPEVKLDTKVCKYLTGATILVTGGGGSIGSELCRQIARYNPERIVIFDIYENNAFTLKNSLDRQYCGAPQVDIRIGSVRDIKRLREIFEEFKPSSVFHAAAHKHVPLMEDSPYEAIKNNILGTYNTAFCANEYGVKNFVLLSTDKAVNPTNVMGASKRVCELVIQHFSKITDGTKFVAVRFGNVLGSNGSVIPIFKEQLENGGPLTVTHPDITRYFMTIPEASQLVVQAGGLAKGGEIFVLDMGEPVKIVTLAENLIRLSGFEPYKDIDIHFTGLRPGEKLYEELSMAEELDARQKTGNDKIFVTKPLEIDDEQLERDIKAIDNMKPDEVRDYLKRLVPNYKPK
ncbi:MAG: polysaccharide biosynthesis protein [Clostridia bacterium]|nr:polysaccharide biosynthesis protein [Clostridia bacterium]